MSAARALPRIFGLTSTEDYDPSVQDRQGEIGLDPPQQLHAGIGGRAPVRPVEEVPVGDQEPVVVQPVSPRGQFTVLAVQQHGGEVADQGTGGVELGAAAGDAAREARSSSVRLPGGLRIQAATFLDAGAGGRAGRAVS